MARNDLIGDIPPSLSISSPARGGFRKETQDSFFQVPFLLYIFLFASFFCFVFVVTPKLRKLAKVSIDGERGEKKAALSSVIFRPQATNERALPTLNRAPFSSFILKSFNPISIAV